MPVRSLSRHKCLSGRLKRALAKLTVFFGKEVSYYCLDTVFIVRRLDGLEGNKVTDLYRERAVTAG